VEKNFQKTGDGCHDQDIMKHESDMQQKVIFPLRDGRGGPGVVGLYSTYTVLDI
jgi:hypothetical protein